MPFARRLQGHHATVTAPLLILVGDAAHNFVDGILLAAAIIAHEIPQEMSDFVLLRNGGWSNVKAFVANAASSFIYVALADLLPLLHRQRDNFLR
ncbi:MAG: ZIP family metal transporter [Zoogloeaceae bacterium]|nr:ZIP family metal transporter [Zoogloeaceae bacterium]